MPKNRVKNRTVPMPEQIRHHIGRGVRVETKRGPGTVTDLLFMVGKWPDGDQSLLPPRITVKLDEPWDGEINITVPLSEIELPDKGHAFRQPVKDLWPGQAPAGPNESLRPTTEPESRKEMKVSSLIGDELRRRADSLKDLVNEDPDEEQSEEDLEDEIDLATQPGPYTSDQYGYLYDYPIRDPNGPSNWTQQFYRPPFINRIWRYYSVRDLLRMSAAEAERQPPK